ncbi:TOM70 [Candida oxycetoniae]|uniref:TOM70 n=1 Tax=Candida oxycetoniae TaxID=497107 RepID=A0AAI9T1D0_9ASCO|nr:TOM70 [Candida oxycetoniae]KAI3406554.2 TOM70 [Candida oxycetoniae]
MSDNFFIKNKTAIIVTALAVTSAVGAFYYYNQQQQQQQGQQGKQGKQQKQGGSQSTASSKGAKKSEDFVEPSSSSSSSSKNKKKKRKNKASSISPEPELVADEQSINYPVDSKGLPKLTQETIDKLSESEKENWAKQLKEDGNKEFKNKEYSRAIAFYSAALQVKKDPIYYSNRSACYAALDDHENVIKDTTEAIKLKNDYTKCILRRATSYEQLEKYEDAMFDLTALTIYGGFSNKSVEQVLERVLRKHSIRIVDAKEKKLVLPSAATIGSFFGAFADETGLENIKESSQVGEKFLYDALVKIQGNTRDGYEEADTLINQAVAALSQDDTKKDSLAIALEYSAAFHFLKNDSATATELINKAIALKPRPRAYVFRALINADKSSYEEALRDFKLAEDLDATSPDIFYHLGQLYYLTGDLPNAEVNFQKAKKLHPDNVYAYIQLACIAYKNGKAEEAYEKFTEAKLKFPISPEIPNYYGEILADNGNIEGALKQFEISARLQEKLDRFSVGALPLINQATVISRESLEKIPEAEELLIKACELDPKSELARISLAQIKLQKEEVDEAIELFEESCDLARSIEEKIQAISFAEASKMQKRIKSDPVLTAKINELMRQSDSLQLQLDLTYVTPQLIVSSGPTTTYIESWYRYPLSDLLQYLNYKHPEHWHLYNFRGEDSGYLNSDVDFHVSHFPFPDHYPPTLDIIWDATNDIDDFVSASEENVAVLHCKAGKGRSGTICCAYLMLLGFRNGELVNVDDIIELYTSKRMRAFGGLGVSILSQQRYLIYWGEFLENESTRVKYSNWKKKKSMSSSSSSSLIDKIVFRKCYRDNFDVYVSNYVVVQEQSRRNTIVEQVFASNTFYEFQFVQVGEEDIEYRFQNPIEVKEDVMIEMGRFCYLWFNIYFELAKNTACKEKRCITFKWKDVDGFKGTRQKGKKLFESIELYLID